MSMGILEDIGKAIGNALASIAKFFYDLIKIKPETREEINKEIAVASIKEEWFKTEEFRNAVKELKEKFKSSPETWSEWVKDLHASLHGQLYDLTLSLILPEKEPSEEEAAKSARALTAYYLDFILFSFILDAVAEIFSLGQLETVGRASQLFVSTFGFDAYARAALAPAIEAGMTEKLRHYWNSRFPTKLPGIGDLVSAVVREFFVKKEEYVDIITKTGVSREDAERFFEMMKEAPAEFKEFCKKLGYSEQWANMYWWNHWIIPTFEQARTFFFRQIGRIFIKTGMERVKEAWDQGKFSEAQEAFRFLQRLADLSPVFRNYWEELSFEYPGRIDTRWMFEWGLIDRKELKSLMLADGLHPEWVDRVAEAYIRNQLRDELNRIRTLWMNFIKEGFRSIDEFRSAMKELGFADHTIEASIKWAEEQRELEIKKDRRDLLVKSRVMGKISKDELEKGLRDLGMVEEAITFWVNYAETMHREEEKRARALTKTEIRDLWRAGIIDEKEAGERLVQIGLSEEDKNLLIKYWKEKYGL